jgi:galactitol-specific phosphotransferase system IIB component
MIDEENNEATDETTVEQTTETETKESSGLLSPDLNNQEENAEGESIDHLANTEEKGEADDNIDWGERPEWMPEQFWDEENGPDLENLAKSYQELRAKMSSGKHKAPKDGKYDISSLADHGVDEDDPLLGEFKGFAKENGLSQDQFDQITQMYMNHVGEIMDKAETDKEAEMAKLGRNSEKVINGLNQWLTKLGTSGALSHEEVDAIASKADSAEFIVALNKIRQSYGEQAIPDATIQEGNAETKSDLDAMVADPRYGKDMAYTQKVERKFMEFFGEA